MVMGTDMGTTPSVSLHPGHPTLDNVEPPKRPRRRFACPREKFPPLLLPSIINIDERGLSPSCTGLGSGRLGFSQ